VRFLSAAPRRSFHAIVAGQCKQPGPNTFNLLDLEGYGYGLFIDTSSYSDVPLPSRRCFFPGVKMVSHGGNLPGYTTLVGTLPEQRFGSWSSPMATASI